MKTIKTILLIAMFVVISANTSNAQTTDFIQVKAEIKQAATQEQNAFRNGECEIVLALMDNNITFLANGRRAPSIEMISKFCGTIKRPFKEPILDSIETYPLTNDSGYSIRTLEYPKSETTKMQEFVTKIWKKIDGQWKIIHLHSTVKEINYN